MTTDPQQSTFPGEVIFDARPPVKYVLQQPADAPRDLVIVFAGMNPVPPTPARYSYLRTLTPVVRNKLFILDDYGPRGCYYLGKDRVLDFEASVTALIRSVVADLGIELSDITACGSSKGGFASLYYGFKYGFGRVIAGGPQTRLGNYLTSRHGTFDNILVWVAGERSEGARLWLNSLLYDVVRGSPHRPDVDLHVGRGDYHLPNHVRPLIDVFESDPTFQWTLSLGDYSEHIQIQAHFPPYLLEQLADRRPEPLPEGQN